MDAHVLSQPEPTEAGIVRPHAFLPGEDTDRATSEEPVPEAPAARIARPSPIRQKLLAGTCATAVLLVGASVFLVSPYHRAAPVREQATASQTASAAGQPGTAVIAPAAKLATAPLPMSGPAPLKSAVAVPPKDAQLQELLAYRGGGSASKKNDPRTEAPSAPTAAAIEEIGVTQPAGQVAANAAPIEVSVPRPAATASSAATTPPASPGLSDHAAPIADNSEQRRAVQTPPAAPTPDPVTIASHMTPAPMTQPQQIQVLALVTELGALIRDEKAEIAALRADQAQTGTKINDFDRRLSLAEARGAINAAMGATPGAVTAADAPAAEPRPAPAERPVRLTPVRVPDPPPASIAVKRYHVQAASPNLAMLTVAGRGSDTTQLEVSIGDDVPGYGKVSSIAERGTTWVIQTDQGMIQ